MLVKKEASSKEPDSQPLLQSSSNDDATDSLAMTKKAVKKAQLNLQEDAKPKPSPVKFSTDSDGNDNNDDKKEEDENKDNDFYGSWINLKPDGLYQKLILMMTMLSGCWQI